MALPTDLRQWTFETILEIVNEHDYEPGRFDFKEVLTPTRGESKAFNAMICKEVCAMANTIGGFLIFGVKDIAAVASPDEDRIVGIPIGGSHRKEFGEKLTVIQPIPRFETVPQAIRLPDKQERGVFVVHIPQSPLRPHMTDRLFYGRGDGGTATPMGYYQVRDLMLASQERWGKVALMRMHIAFVKGEAERVKSVNRCIFLFASGPQRYV
jgi:predicted HTH transcriptional regulator